MAANDVSKGGSFYLQSKVYRAKEMLEQYQKEKRMEEQAQAKSDS
jgi:mitochondrial import inner membrane translocase subunit TIM16